MPRLRLNKVFPEPTEAADLTQPKLAASFIVGFLLLFRKQLIVCDHLQFILKARNIKSSSELIKPCEPMYHYSCSLSLMGGGAQGARDL